MGLAPFTILKCLLIYVFLRTLLAPLSACPSSKTRHHNFLFQEKSWLCTLFLDKILIIWTYSNYLHYFCVAITVWRFLIVTVKLDFPPTFQNDIKQNQYDPFSNQDRAMSTEHVQNKENINKRTSLFVLIIPDYN